MSPQVASRSSSAPCLLSRRRAFVYCTIVVTVIGWVSTCNICTAGVLVLVERAHYLRVANALVVASSLQKLPPMPDMQPPQASTHKLAPWSIPRKTDSPRPAGTGGRRRDSPRLLIVWTITILLASATVAWGLFLARRVLLLVYVSALLAIGVSPLVQLIERQRLLPIGTLKLPRWLAILIIYLTLLAILSGAGALIVPVLAEQAQELAIAAVGELVPYLGPLLTAIPGISVAASASWQLAIGVVVFYAAQQQTEANLIVPKLMERQVGLSPSGVIIALLFGGALLGIFGAILAIPTAAILQVILQHFVSNGNRNGSMGAQGSG